MDGGIMKCEHNKEITIIFQMISYYMDDGGYIVVEGCEICADNFKEETREGK
jgi:hypothetical protein